MLYNYCTNVHRCHTTTVQTYIDTTQALFKCTSLLYKHTSILYKHYINVNYRCTILVQKCIRTVQTDISTVQPLYKCMYTSTIQPPYKCTSLLYKRITILYNHCSNVHYCCTSIVQMHIKCSPLVLLPLYKCTHTSVLYKQRIVLCDHCTNVCRALYNHCIHISVQ